MKILFTIAIFALLAGCVRMEQNGTATPPSLLNQKLTDEEVKVIAENELKENAPWVNLGNWNVRPKHIRKTDDGWSVIAERIIGYDSEGNAQFTPGGWVQLLIDDNGSVTGYRPGR